MPFSKPSAEEIDEMRQDAASESRRRAFRRAQVTIGSAEENLERLWRLLARLEPVIRHRPPRRSITRIHRALL